MAQNKPAGNSGIRLDTLLHFSIRNLLFKKLRSFLTILGVVIGIGAVFMLTSFGLGLQSLVQDQIIGSESIKTIDATSPNSSIVQINDSSINRFNEFEHVTEVATTYSRAGRISFNSSISDAVVFGSDEDFIQLSNLELVAGSLLKSDSTDKIVVNTSLMNSIGITDPKDALEQEIAVLLPDVGDNEEGHVQTFQVIGVIDSGSGSEVFIPPSVFSANGVEDYSQVKLVVDEEANVIDVRAQIEALGFETNSPVDTLNQVNRVFKFFNFILLGFGGIGMLIAVLGMLNTLTISLLERTQEIGLMVALGARRRDMKKLFVSEALLLSVIGGAVGILGAAVLGGFIDLFLNRLAYARGVSQGFSVFSTPIWLILLILLFMAAVGFAVVYIPARRAARINPIEALRHE